MKAGKEKDAYYVLGMGSVAERKGKLVEAMGYYQMVTDGCPETPAGKDATIAIQQIKSRLEASR